jgi:hypothetical protein
MSKAKRSWSLRSVASIVSFIGSSMSPAVGEATLANRERQGKFWRLDYDPIQLNRIIVQNLRRSMILSENRYPPSDQVRGQAFSGSCSRAESLNLLRK